ncbi:hypothetical protein CMI37_13140 [Candidatus Pacearchaeota archaeon]|nr:hypothetical protein [Candidatus Pacearchaeota archaeon]|tara:strand:+ start:604 stop:1608 length:1005 start_codon:yes stop_codon:yes gene_type:complete
MPGVRTLRKIQLGQETTAGTAVVATGLWLGNGVISDARTRVSPEIDQGLMLPVAQSYDTAYLAELAMEETEATFEQLSYILSAAIEDVTTGVRDGTDGSGYVYQHDLTTNAQVTPQTYTIEMGDDQRVDEMEYAVVREFSLSCAKQEGWMTSATWFGRQVTDAEFTASIATPTIEQVVHMKTKLYLDTSGGTIGTTQKTSCFLGLSLSVTTGFQPIPVGDGNLYYAGIKQIEPGVTGTLHLEHDATGEAELVLARTPGTVRLIRTIAEGAALTTASAYTYKTLRFDGAIEYINVPPLGEDEGDDIIDLEFRVVWLAAKSLGGQILVVNELSALT